MTQLLQRYPYCSSVILAGLIGALFPTLTTLLLLWRQSLGFNLRDIVLVHQGNLALYVTWSAPLVLGFFGFLVGKSNWLLKKQMDSLKQQSIQMNTLLDTTSSAIITIDKQGMVTSFNKAAESIFGYPAIEVLGKNIKCLMPDSIAEQHDGYLQRYLSTRQATIIGLRRETQGRRKNGQIFPILLRINPMQIDDEISFSGFIDDISDTKELEIQLMRAQKLEAIGQLAAGLAHEINTPIQYVGDNLSVLKQNMADITAYQQGLSECAADESKPRIQSLAEQYDMAFILEDSPHAIQQALEGVNRVAEIVKAMQTYSHMEPAQNKQAIDLREVLHSALTISRNSYKYLANIETEFADDLPEIECHAGQLNQVLLNLIINAAHSIEEKQAGMGLIRIVTRKVGNMAEILIQDNGAGIPEPIQEKVFNLFFTTKPAGKGTGQGLSLAHNVIVEKHQGKLFFESEAGVGTSFHIQLPLHPAKRD